MYLRGVENHPQAPGPVSRRIEAMRTSGAEIGGILHLLAFKPEAAGHLERFAECVMRGPSPLSAGQRELIAAFTSSHNHCPF